MSSKTNGGPPHILSQSSALLGRPESGESRLSGRSVKRVGSAVKRDEVEGLDELRVGASRPLRNCISLLNVERDAKGYRADDGRALVDKALEAIEQARVRAATQRLPHQIVAIETELKQLKQSGMVRSDYYNFATDLHKWLEKELESFK